MSECPFAQNLQKSRPARIRRGFFISGVALIVILPGQVALGAPEACLSVSSLEPSKPTLWIPSQQLAKKYHKTITGNVKARVSVRLIMPGGALIKDTAVVTLKPEHGTDISLTRTKGTPEFSADVVRGRYLITANSGEFNASPRFLVVDDDLRGLMIHLGRPNSPYFRMDGGLIPFTPTNNMIAIAYDHSPPKPSEAAQIASDLKRKLGLEMHTPSCATDKLSFFESKGQFLLFDLPAGANQANLLGNLRDGLPRYARAGIPIDLTDRYMRVLDRRFTVRTNQSFDAGARDELFNRMGILKVRTHSYDDNLWLVEFSSDDFSKNLGQLNCLIDEGVIIVGEPNLFIQTDNTDSLEDWPNDPRYKNLQYATDDEKAPNHHGRQKIRQAWTLSDDPDHPLIGDPSIYVGIIDRAIDPRHSEFSCRPTDLSGNTCFDPVNIKRCDETGYEKPSANDRHGMAVLGIIAACANNTSDIAGIAPSTNHIAVGRPPSTSDDFYANVLLWTAGLPISCNAASFDYPSHPCHWPPIDHPAHVINASHEFVPKPLDFNPNEPGHALPLPPNISASFEALVSKGRSGKGTLLVYASGNGPWSMDEAEPLARDYRTIAVANCWVNANGLEVRYAGEQADVLPSTWGTALDLCALGQNSQTIMLENDAATQTLGGSSAAAAAVSATIGLMLSANADLTWRQVKSILRGSADLIDQNQSDEKGKWLSKRSQWYGSGRLNTCAAVREAIEWKTQGGRNPWPNGDPCR
jgi:hypothetical protein